MDTIKTNIAKYLAIAIDVSSKNPMLVYGSLATIASYFASKKLVFSLNNLQDRLLKNHSNDAPTTIHNEKRQRTYPSINLNSWYHFLDSDELQVGDVKEVKALGRVFVLWRTADGKPVCQDAYCIHLGANLAVGGAVVDNCIECPFHKWKFASDGSVADIPYNVDKDHKCTIQKKLRTYHCADYCGMIYVYVHDQDKPPEYELPEYLSNELKDEKWSLFYRWNAGYHTHTVVDWIDQAGDHIHFPTLHGNFVIPWTTIPIPDWIYRIFPLGINHVVTTYRGDEPAWIEKHQENGKYWTGKHFIFFTDRASLTWKGEVLEASSAETMEIYLGPATIVMNVPFTIGAFKLFWTMLPVEGGVILRSRNYIDRRTQLNPVIYAISWVLQGISASQLWSDISILDHKIRMAKPILQAADGPWGRVSNWMKLFLPESNQTGIAGYKNDW